MQAIICFPLSTETDVRQVDLLPLGSTKKLSYNHSAT